MPWCVTCDRFLSPPTVRPDGTCPTCGRAVDPGRARLAAEAPPADAPGAAAPAFPWHLKLLLVAVVVYLGYRFVEMGGWLWDRVG